VNDFKLAKIPEIHTSGSVHPYLYGGMTRERHLGIHCPASHHYSDTIGSKCTGIGVHISPTPMAFHVRRNGRRTNR
jgi:hypothetical protein